MRVNLKRKATVFIILGVINGQKYENYIQEIKKIKICIGEKIKYEYD
ncbi:MAG: hypothetical protein ACFFB8_17280 [Promethearchaeota archaeon]